MTGRGCWSAPRRAGLGPQVLALRRPRRDLAGDAQRRRPLPRRTPTPRSSGSGSWCPGAEPGVVYAGTEPGAVFRSTDGGETFDARAGALGPPAPARVGRRLRRPGLPHRAPAPDRPAVGDRRALDRRRLPDQRRRRVLGAAQPRHPGRVPARGPAVPRVRPVRAQGRPAPVRARAAVPAEPRRRLPLRRRRRRLGSPSPTGCPPTSASRSSCTRTSPTRSSCSRSAAATPATRRTPRPRVWRSRDAGETWEELGDGPAGRRSTSAVMRDAMCADQPRPGRDLLRRPQRRGLGLRRRGRDLARDRRRPARRDGGARGPV